MARVVVLPAADADLMAIVAYVARENESAAIRLYDGLRETFRMLALQPLMGGCFTTPRHREARCFSYGSYVVFYRPIEQGIEVLRVLHGARDYRKLL